MNHLDQLPCRRTRFVLLFTVGALLSARLHAQDPDPLPSWNEGNTKQAILDFVEAVTDENSDGYVPPAERIACFDNDGTLWVEQPIYTQVSFIFDRVKELEAQHPEWNTTQPFQALLAGDMQTVGASGEKGILQMGMATHAGMSSDDFAGLVTDWLQTATHPRFNRPYTELVYQPQLELLTFLRDKGFKTFIVSGGGISFMRPWTEEIYGIPAEQVVGSSIVTEFQIQDGEPVLMRMPRINFINDKEGKPVGIARHIGRRPILAFGNADADMQMIQYTTAGDGHRLGLFVHHTDADREYAYDRDSHVGKLDQVLDTADDEGWIVVDMRDDWNRVFPDSNQQANEVRNANDNEAASR